MCSNHTPLFNRHRSLDYQLLDMMLPFLQWGFTLVYKSTPFSTDYEHYSVAAAENLVV